MFSASTGETKTMLLSCEPLPCNPAAEAALQPLIVCLFSYVPDPDAKPKHSRNASQSPNGGTEKGDPIKQSLKRHFCVTLKSPSSGSPFSDSPFGGR